MVKHNNSTLVGETSNIVTRDEALRLPVVVGDPLAGNNHSLMEDVGVLVAAVAIYFKVALVWLLLANTSSLVLKYHGLSRRVFSCFVLDLWLTMAY